MSSAVPERRPLRVLVAVDDLHVPAFVARAIERLGAAPVELAGVLVASGGKAPVRSYGALEVLDRADRSVFGVGPDAMRPVDLRGSCPALLRDTMRTPPDGARPDPDVVLDLTAEGVPLGLAPPPRHGFWSLRFGRDGVRLGARAFVTDYLSGADTGVCELWVQERAGRSAADSRVARRSVSGLDRLSPARTRNEAAWKAAELPARLLTALDDQGPRVLRDLPRREEVCGSGPTWRAPMLATTMARRGVREATRRVVSRPEWFVAVRAGAEARAGQPGFHTNDFEALDAPAGRFYADPFVITRPGGGAYVFVEDGPVAGGPARLTVLTLDDNGRQCAGPRVVLERPTHLSYPSVLRDGNSWFLMPETAGTGEVELLHAVEFPWRWKPCATLLTGVRAWDPTVLRHGGRYWLFVTVASPGARPSDELHLYTAPALAGPWEPHRANPVVSDVRRARPAGRVLEHDGTLLRPAQDGSGAYGRRVVLNRIDVLTEDEYVETPVGTIEPGWLPGVERTHTYTADGRFEAMDGIRYRRRAWPLSRYGRPRAR